MRTYIRESVDLGNNRRLITHYTPSEYFWLSAIKFFFFLTVIWPLELVFWLGYFVLKYTIKLLIFLIKLPFKLAAKKKENDE